VAPCCFRLVPRTCVRPVIPACSHSLRVKTWLRVLVLAALARRHAARADSQRSDTQAGIDCASIRQTDASAASHARRSGPGPGGRSRMVTGVMQSSEVDVGRQALNPRIAIVRLGGPASQRKRASGGHGSAPPRPQQQSSRHAEPEGRISSLVRPNTLCGRRELLVGGGTGTTKIDGSCEPVDRHEVQMSMRDL